MLLRLGTTYTFYSKSPWIQLLGFMATAAHETNNRGLQPMSLVWQIMDLQVCGGDGQFTQLEIIVVVQMRWVCPAGSHSDVSGHKLIG